MSLSSTQGGARRDARQDVEQRALHRQRRDGDLDALELPQHDHRLVRLFDQRDDALDERRQQLGQDSYKNRVSKGNKCSDTKVNVLMPALALALRKFDCPRTVLQVRLSKFDCPSSTVQVRLFC